MMMMNVNICSLREAILSVICVFGFLSAMTYLVIEGTETSRQIKALCHIRKKKQNGFQKTARK
jgi:hypothetical protein